MSVAKAIFSRLKSASEVSALCRTVFAADAEEAGTFPRIVYDVNDEQDDRTYAGSSGLIQAFVDVDCIDLQYNDARELGRAVIAATNNQSGTWGGVKVKAAFYRGKSESGDQPLPGSQFGSYTQTIHLEIWIEG